MSNFMTLKKSELIDVAENVAAATFEESWTKEEIVRAIEEAGLTWEDYQMLLSEAQSDREETVSQAEEELELNQPTQEKVLLRMTRKNGTYEIGGARFTREKPFALVKEEDVDWIINNVDGFRPATAKEVRDFYSR